MQGEPVDLEITGAALAQLENRAEPYPASLALKLNQSDLRGDLVQDPFKEVPAKQFNVPELRAFDARISFAGETVQAMKLPLQQMEAKVTLQDGHIRIDPARVGLAGGKVEAAISLTARDGVLNGDLDLTLRNLKLDQLLSSFKVDVAAIEMKEEGVGTFGGQAKLTIKGNSIHDMAAAADGELAVVMGGEQINALIIEALGLDVGEMLAVVAAGSEEKESEMVPVQCFVSRFEV